MLSGLVPPILRINFEYAALLSNIEKGKINEFVKPVGEKIARSVFKTILSITVGATLSPAAGAALAVFLGIQDIKNITDADLELAIIKSEDWLIKKFDTDMKAAIEDLDQLIEIMCSMSEENAEKSLDIARRLVDSIPK